MRNALPPNPRFGRRRDDKNEAGLENAGTVGLDHDCRPSGSHCGARLASSGDAGVAPVAERREYNVRQPVRREHHDPWDGTGDYLLGTYYDTENSGLTFRYTYDDGDHWVTPGSSSGFGEEVASGLYTFTGNGPDGAYEMATWAWDLGDNFIINPIGGSDPLDFTCSIQ